MANVLAFPSAPIISDESARQQALDTRASWIVEAPAGSGKTGLLMQRYLKLLGEPEVAQPEEVLAITFTRKATAELRSRILEELEAALQNTPVAASDTFETTTRTLAQKALTRDSQLNWGLLENPNRLRIRTIDSVCTEIANSLPLLSGSGTGSKAVEDANPLYHLAARRTIMQLGTDTSLHEALRTVLLHRDGSLRDVETLLAKMLAAREQWAELVPLDQAFLADDTLETIVRPRLERTLETIVCTGLTRAINSFPPNLLRELSQLAARIGLEPGYKDATSPIAICANRNQPPSAVADSLDHWRALIYLLLKKDGEWRRTPNSFYPNILKVDLEKADRATVSRIVEDIIASFDEENTLLTDLNAVLDLPPAKYPDAQWHVAKALFSLLLHALAELKVLFAERSECDFAEYSLAARDALRSETGPADLSSSAGAILRHLLVDEMQDTSASQYELIQTLTRHWDGHSQTLFLVGDPKQSIYLFRQARVERFLRTIRDSRLGDVPVQPLQLHSNFRSQATLVESFNDAFSLIFPETLNTSSGESIDVPFVAAVPTRPATDSEGTFWHTTLIAAPDAQNPQPVPQSDHATTIRQIVEYWQTKPLPADRTSPWKIAILARARRHLAPIVTEFKAAGIPFRAIKVEALNERPEVLDVLALTRALLHPADRVAWLAVFHAPWCGLSLADLLTLTNESDPETTLTPIPQLVSNRLPYLTQTGQVLLNKSWPTLESALKASGRGALAVRVERTWRSLGGDATLNPDQLTNVKRFFALLRELEQPGDWIDLRALQTRLNQLFAESSSTPGAVDLMTIHSSKGLEWDVVLIPALEKKGQTSRSDLLNWLELDSAHESCVILAPIYGKGADPDPIYKWLNKVRSAREAAERKRLFYVACTRAREELHLFATCKLTSTGETAQPVRDSLLSACWPAASKQFVHTQTPTAQPQSSEDLTFQFKESLQNADYERHSPLAIAASAPEPPPLIHRLPQTFNPLARFTPNSSERLHYLAALKPAVPFDRPEGSFAVRAFGNVVHRYLQVLSNRLTSATPAKLLAELPAWEPRLLASLRGEGLAPTVCRREASRARAALTRALTDPIGLWILCPQPAATTERALTSAAATLRVDRSFLAAATPLALGNTHIWIVDFKTTEQGARTPEQFEAAERAKYTAQLQSYAAAQRALSPASGAVATPIMLALYYPLVPRLIHWPA